MRGWSLFGGMSLLVVMLMPPVQGQGVDEVALFATAPFHRSVEELVVGGGANPGTQADLPAFFGITSFDASANGLQAVFVASGPVSEPDEEPRRVFTVSTTSGGLTEYLVPEADMLGPPWRVRMSDDGTTFVLSGLYEEGFRFLVPDNGPAPQLAVLTDHSPLDNFIDSGVEINTDGRRIFYRTEHEIWRLDAGAEGAPTDPQFDPELFFDLDEVDGATSFTPTDIAINQAGTFVLAGVRFDGGDTGVLLLQGLESSTGAVEEDVEFAVLVRDPGEGTGAADPSSLGAFEDRLTYCLGAINTRRCELDFDDAPGDPSQVISLDVPGGTAPGELDAVTLFGSGFVGQHKEAGTSTAYVDFIERADRRTVAHSPLIAGMNAGGPLRVDNDGDIILGTTGVSGAANQGLWQTGVGTPDGVSFPEIHNLRVGIDEAADEYVIRVTTSHIDGIGTLQVQAMYDGWVDPVGLFEQDANPFYDIRGNFGTLAWELVEDGPRGQLWQRRIGLAGRADLIDSDLYSLVVGVETPDGNRATFWQVPALTTAALALPPVGLDGDPVTTERLDLSEPVLGALAVSQTRFDEATGTRQGMRQAAHVVLSRDDVFVDSLAGAPLVGDGPILFTDPQQLSVEVRAEIDRLLDPGGTVYVLGGPAAVSTAVEQELTAVGYEVVRLAGPSRVETAVAIAEEVRTRYPEESRVLLARADATPDNPTAAWADSVTGGAWAAFAKVPIVVTQTESLHPQTRAFLDRTAPTQTIILGGTAAISDTVEAQVPNPMRVAGASRDETAARIAQTLWLDRASDARSYVLLNGYDEDGWVFGLSGAGLAADSGSPVLMVDPTRVPPSTLALVTSAGDAPEVDLLLLGDRTVIAEARQRELDAVDR